MAYMHFQRLFICRLKLHYRKRGGALHLYPMLYHCGDDAAQQELLPSEWYEKAFRKIRKLSYSLKNVDSIDGRLVNVNDDSTITDERIEQSMRTLKSLVRILIGSPSAQRRVTESAIALNPKIRQPYQFFKNPSEREPMVVDSLTKVSNYLNVSAQQRKLVRHTICPQVTEHRIWTGALEQILNELKFELESLTSQSPNTRIEMGQQIIYSCLKFLDNATNSINSHSTSWMRPTPFQATADSSISPTWKDILEMFNDLIHNLKDEKWLLHYLTKLEVMKEGLSQIKDVPTDKSIAYKEAKHHDNLVKKKLSKTLGHSSRCLFTLLLYYLSGHFRDLEVDFSGGVLKDDDDDDKFCLFMGRILSSDEERMVWNGVKQLDRAMGLFKFIWETAGIKGSLKLHGHLWCVGAEEKQLNYKGNLFSVHEISI